MTPQPGSLTLRMRVTPRERLPGDERSWLTLQIAHMLRDQGRLGLAGVVLRERSVELIELASTMAAGMPVAHLLAGLSTTSTSHGRALAVGLVGRLERRDRRAPGAAVPLAVVFLEWEDCRWWMWQAALSADGSKLVEPSILEKDAVDGDPLPDGLGRWWTLARRMNMRMSIEPLLTAPASEAVH